MYIIDYDNRPYYAQLYTYTYIDVFISSRRPTEVELPIIMLGDTLDVVTVITRTVVVVFTSVNQRPTNCRGLLLK